METTIQIDGRDVKFRASAAVPRLYRIKFRRDIMQDMARLQRAFVRVMNEKPADMEDDTYIQQKGFEILDLEIFENVAFAMAQHADPTIPNEVGEWLDQFEMFSIYQVLPEILALWVRNEESLVESKKKLDLLTGR